MSHAMVTIAVRIDVARVAEARTLINALGNPAGAIGARLGGAPGAAFLHFASLHAIASRTPGRAYLLLELSADGDAAAAIGEFAKRAGELLLPVFRVAEPKLITHDLAAFLQRHQFTSGYSLFRPPGLAFSGVPGMSVEQIRREKALADEAAALVAGQGQFASSLARLADVRRSLAGNPDLKWALDLPPDGAPAPKGAPGVAAQAVALFPALIGNFLWPFLLIIVPLSAWIAWPATERLNDVIAAVLSFLVLVIALTLVTVAVLYLSFRRGEDRDWISSAAPTLDQQNRMFAHENATSYAHNHMISHTVRKPGLLRGLTLRLAFCAIAKLTALNPKAGFLGDIGTIHFARWVTIPGTRDLIFLSNYGGSWESYLEDFITRAHAGLTGVWSNTIGFPRTTNLFMDGAIDGERFKRFARESMDYTPFWYSGYPALTTANIRTNALVRRGLNAQTEVEAVDWLALFGSTPRPPGKLDTTQIQSIIFGGLGFKPEGRLLTVRLDEDEAANRAWLHDLLPSLTFNDGRYIADDAVVTLALTPSGLTRLGLPASALESFPAAFRLGMRGQGRARILGDDPFAAEWWWDSGPVEAAMLVYGDTPAAVERRVRDIDAALKGVGTIVDQVELTKVGDTLAERKEPFGFVDGVSQPAIRGTYRGLRNADPIHLVEPGEIILGYPDNRGAVPPGPLLDARYDPEMVLPIAGNDHGFAETVKANPRLIGFNGSYLVIRQLEQDSVGFNAYCEREAERFAARFPAPAICDAEFIGAKMIGRWKDGSSLARNPYMSATRLQELYGKADAGGTMREKAKPADAAATPVEAGDRTAPPKAPSDAKAPKPDNDFLFGTEDPQGLRCPYGAHVRRANPRDSLSPGSMEQVEITNRHRILRIGRGFAGKGDRQSGLMFMCLNGDIERQYEFIQQTWMGSVKFHGLDKETDPIAVTGEAGSNGFTIPVRTGPVALDPLPRFVTLRGGGYFFVPGRQLLNYLSAGGSR